VAGGVRRARAVLVLAALTVAALATVARPAGAFDRERYLGHLVLGGTTLVITEAVGGLDVPWDVAAGPDGWIWFTEQKGRVHRYDPATGEVQDLLLEVPDLFYRKSLGLLGMALHPDFARRPWVFLHYTYREIAPDQSDVLRSRLVRYRFEGGGLVDPVVLLDAIPGKSYHNGSRIVVTRDDRVFLSTGDAGDPEGAQDPSKLNGKILRLDTSGGVPPDNPFPGSPVWSYGHRNVQGMVMVGDVLLASEHGPNNDDEVNRVRRGANHGWPIVEGFVDTEPERRAAAGRDVVEPLRAWTPTIATAGLAWYDSPRIPEWRHSLLLANLKGRALRVLHLDPALGAVDGERIYFQKRFGRLRDVCVTPGGDVYVATSNRDWHPRFQPWMYDSLPEGPDRILRLWAAGPDELAQIASLDRPAEIREDPEPMPLLSEDWSFPASDEDVSRGESLYRVHCAACHLPDGRGIAGLVPPLVGTDWVTGDKSRLIRIVLEGLSDPIEIGGERYEQEMPGYATRSDDELAALLTVVRERFGGGGGAVIPGEVYEERKGTR